MGILGQIYYNVIDNNEGKPISVGPDIFNDIVTSQGISRITKLGVQAPPGTKFVINGNDDKGNTIMVGRTGIYELDEDVSIEHLYFIKPHRYVKDEEESAKHKKEGEEGMLAADEKRKTAMADLNKDPIPDEFLEDGVTLNPAHAQYWEKYNEIQSVYIREYTEALNKFNTGCNGIYILPNPDNVNDPANFEELFNVIIDYIYEEE